MVLPPQMPIALGWVLSEVLVVHWRKNNAKTDMKIMDLFIVMVT